jgi:TatD DNase family protein
MRRQIGVRWLPLRRPARRRLRGGGDPPNRDGAPRQTEAATRYWPRSRTRGAAGGAAVGETGLDYYRDYAAPELQRDWFRAHIEIAKAAGKALMIHDRDAHADVLDILELQGAPEHVVFHCFSGDAEMAKRCADSGYVMSFAGNVTFPSAGQLRERGYRAVELILVRPTRPPDSRSRTGRDERACPGRARARRRGQADGCCRAVAAVMATGERVFGRWRG